jgi:hypothetical protein
MDMARGGMGVTPGVLFFRVPFSRSIVRGPPGGRAQVQVDTTGRRGRSLEPSSFRGIAVKRYPIEIVNGKRMHRSLEDKTMLSRRGYLGILALARKTWVWDEVAPQIELACTTILNCSV